MKCHPKVLVATVACCAVVLIAWLFAKDDCLEAASQPLGERYAHSEDLSVHPSVGDTGASRFQPDRAPSSTPTPSGVGVVLLDVETGAALPDLAVQVEAAVGGAVHTSSHFTDHLGRIALPPGEWRLDASSKGYGPPNVECRITNRIEVVWLRPRVNNLFRVVDPEHRPIPGAYAFLSSGSELVGEPHQSGPDGVVNFDPLWIEPGLRVVVTHAGYQPRQVDIYSEVSTRGFPREVQMKPCTETWTLVVQDPLGTPMEGVSFSVYSAGACPTLPVGKTGPDGRLSVGGSWMYHGYQWVLGGAAFDCRFAPPSYVSGGGDFSPVVLTAPRRSRGAIALAGRAGGPIEWRVTEPSPRPLGSGILPVFFSQTEAEGLVPMEMPANWPARIQCLSRGSVVFEQVATVAGDGWTLTATLDPPRDQRHVTLRSLSAPFAKIRCGERLLFSKEADVSGIPVYVVDCEVEREHVTLEATFTTGVRYLLVGKPGLEDAVLDLDPPTLVRASINVQDERGLPVRDVALCLSRVTDRGLTPTSASDWQSMVAGNVLRLPVDADGIAHANLMTGEYEVEIEHLAQRNSLGMRWSPLEPLRLNVPAQGSAHFAVTVTRPRLVSVVLDSPIGESHPGFWVLQVGSYSATYGGSSCRLWLTEQAQELLILDQNQRQIGIAQIAAGRAPVTIKVPLAIAR